jgi:beta-lactamase regulating signal transducer with metallopeptidase domain
MLQYLINASAIWLICLLCYEALFRRESFYKYNRLFLLFSLAAGLLLPAVSLNKIIPVVSQERESFAQPVSQVYKLKRKIAGADVPQVKNPQQSASTQVSGSNTQLLLWSIYFAGLVIGLVLIFREALYLYRLYKSGRKTALQGCILVETGKKHGPFSFFKLIFVSSRQDYKDTEWKWLWAHEMEHKLRFHSLDNLAVIATRLIFWFHPLPHIFFKKLRMVHEFQADKAAATEIQEYGTFLLEQSLLQPSQTLTHSFNYSPIKIRIAMLTRVRSARTHLLKYLAVFPVMLILIFFCTQVVSGEMNSRAAKVYFKGNEIIMGELKVIPYSYRDEIQNQKKIFMHASLPDSVLVKDWRANRWIMQPVLAEKMPLSINGKHIFGQESQYLMSDADVDYTAPVFGEAGDFEEYLFSKLQPELNKLDDGAYGFKVNRVVIDDRGAIAYYEEQGIEKYIELYAQGRDISKNLKEAIQKKMAEALNTSVKFTPAQKDGRAINARVGVGIYNILVKHHKATLMKDGGC